MELENPMRRIKISKVVLNIGVGKSGEPLEKAAKVLEQLTGQKPSFRKAKRTIRDFGIHRKEPIGVMVTVRGEKAGELLRKLLKAREDRLPPSSFDEFGNVNFGIKEHIDIPGMKYDPDIGIFGMNVCVSLERPGYRVMRRRRMRSKVGRKHRIGREEAIEFFKREFGVEVVG